ncbi:TRAP transporter large permease [Marinomonas flavescens]|uniref:TRAP transporter large permease n=1 Tax=Marinomonas flavescens TaxID=2529379 RepID=UPI001054703C|nr:TRAP transporter large permease [Marinomonas flavescens]
MLSIVLFCVLGMALLLNFPVAIALGISVLITIITVPGAPPISSLISSMISLSDSFTLIAVPLFVLAGEVMQTGGLSKRLVNLAFHLVGKVRAGMAYVNILASMFFAAISGSAPATVAAVGSNLIPQMHTLGYKKDFSSALTASSGMIGVLIPPSIPMIVYGVSANVSIGALFLAGIVPGILLGILFAITSRIIIGKSLDNHESRNLSADLIKESTISVFKNAFWALLTPLIILGGIYGGVFTPTEAGAVAVVYAIIISIFVYKELTLKQLYDLLFSSAKVSARILSLVLFSIAFGRLVTIAEVPQQVAMALQSVSDNPIIIIAMLNLLLLIVGMFMETIAAIIILTPILLPVAVAAGVGPLSFGVIMTVNLAIGFCTPPLGVNLFVASSVSKVSVNQISKAILPFGFSMLIVLLITSYFPESFLFLVNLL